MNHDVKDSGNPVYSSLCLVGMLLARDSIVGISIPSSISLPASLFTRYRNTQSRDQLLSHFELIEMTYYRVGPEIPLRHTE